jgi:hypothetical protein
MYIEIPIMNPFNFVDKNRELIANYNFKHFDAWMSNEQIITPYEVYKCYKQPWQLDDIAKLQVQSDFTPIRLQVRNTRGLVILSQLMSVVRTIGSLIYLEDQIAFDLFDEGIYTLEVLGGDPVLMTIVSEPFCVKYNQPGTMLMNVSNQFNNEILWETGITINFRVNGVIPYDSPIAVRTVYIDQPGAASTVKGTASRKFKFYIGCNGGLPPWYVDKINEYLGQTDVIYDGKGFAAVPGVDWSTTKIERYPWAQWNIDMRQTTNTRMKRFEVTGLQEKKFAQDVIINTKLFGALYGSSNDNTITINTIS